MSVYGYKAMNPDMTCRGIEFAVGETYRVDGPPEVCRRGYHFCEKAPDVFLYYPLFGSVVCEVEALGDVVTDGAKSCTDRIRIVRRMSPVEEVRLRYSDGNGDGDGDGHGYGNGHVNGYGYGYGSKISRVLAWKE